MDLLKKLHQDDSAVTAVEYAVMLAMIIIACLAAIGTFGGQVNTMFNNIDTEMDNHF